jgi:PBP1b-binding outer membrane lipoprotein LpoB
MRLLAFLICIGCAINASAESDWVNVGSNESHSYDVQAASFEETTTKDGAPILVALGRSLNKKTSRVEVNKWSVSIADCNRKMGTFVVLDINGKRQVENDFAFGAGNVSSVIAETLCFYAQYQNEKRQQKSADNK